MHLVGQLFDASTTSQATSTSKTKRARVLQEPERRDTSMPSSPSVVACRVHLSSATNTGPIKPEKILGYIEVTWMAIEKLVDRAPRRAQGISNPTSPRLLTIRKVAAIRNKHR
jgi:hypothetical protein